MKIAICEDDALFSDKLTAMADQYLSSLNIKPEITVYSSGEQLLDVNVLDYKIIFMDINLAQLNGIETAEVLRKRNPHFVLIFVSAFLDFAPASFEVDGFRYLLKNQLDTTFVPAVDAALEKLGLFRRSIVLDFKIGPTNVYVDEIVYVESKKHKSFFVLSSASSDAFFIYSKLDEIEKILPKNFVRVHQSFLINLDYVSSTTSTTFELFNGEKLPVSQKRSAEARRRYILYEAEK